VAAAPDRLDSSHRQASSTSLLCSSKDHLKSKDVVQSLSSLSLKYSLSQDQHPTRDQQCDSPRVLKPSVFRSPKMSRLDSFDQQDFQNLPHSSRASSIHASPKYYRSASYRSPAEQSFPKKRSMYGHALDDEDLDTLRFDLEDFQRREGEAEQQVRKGDAQDEEDYHQEQRTAKRYQIMLQGAARQLDAAARLLDNQAWRIRHDRSSSTGHGFSASFRRPRGDA
jgi:hypothetical protein